MVSNFIVSAEIVVWPFVVSAEIVAVGVEPFFVAAEVAIVRPPARLVSDLWEEHYEARRQYDKALEVWRQAENLVNLNAQRTASACHDTADSAFATALHLRKSLSKVIDDRIGMSELVEV